MEAGARSTKLITGKSRAGLAGAGERVTELEVRQRELPRRVPAYVAASLLILSKLLLLTVIQIA